MWERGREFCMPSSANQKKTHKKHRRQESTIQWALLLPLIGHITCKTPTLDIKYRWEAYVNFIVELYRNCFTEIYRQQQFGKLYFYIQNTDEYITYKAKIYIFSVSCDLRSDLWWYLMITIDGTKHHKGIMGSWVGWGAKTEKEREQQNLFNIEWHNKH